MNFCGLAYSQNMSNNFTYAVQFTLRRWCIDMYAYVQHWDGWQSWKTNNLNYFFQKIGSVECCHALSLCACVCVWETLPFASISLWLRNMQTKKGSMDEGKQLLGVKETCWPGKCLFLVRTVKFGNLRKTLRPVEPSLGNIDLFAA